MPRIFNSAPRRERAGSPRSGWRSRGYLPHHDVVGCVQHIVFRLADALPGEVLATLEAAPIQDRLDAAEAALDAGVGSRALADPRVAEIVESALIHFDAERYRLVSWCVMPTHVHVLAAQVEGWPLSSVVHAWKSFTANRANEVLGWQGRFWAPEYFDRVMRDDEHIEATGAYIENNPVAAGLCATAEDWPWSSRSRSARADRGLEEGQEALAPGFGLVNLDGGGVRRYRPRHGRRTRQFRPADAAAGPRRRGALS